MEDQPEVSGSVPLDVLWPEHSAEWLRDHPPPARRSRRLGRRWCPALGRGRLLNRSLMLRILRAVLQEGPQFDVS